MTKKITVKEAEEEVVEGREVVAPIEVTFSNGDLNSLKDKINELVARANQ